MIRDGAKLFFEKPGPKLTPRQLERAQPAFSDPTAKEEVRKKVFKVKNRQYIVGTTRLDIASIIINSILLCQRAKQIGEWYMMQQPVG